MNDRRQMIERSNLERRVAQDRRQRSNAAIQELIVQRRQHERRTAQRRENEIARTSAMQADFFARYHAAQRALTL